MRSSWSLGILFIAFGGLAVSGIGGHRPIGPVPWAIAALLVVAGAFWFTGLRAAKWLAIVVGVLTAVTGVLFYAHHPELALPVPGWLSIVIGLYLVLRTAMAVVATPPKRRGFLPRDEEPEA